MKINKERRKLRMKFEEIRKYFVEEEGCEGVYCFDEDKLDNMTKKK